MELHDLEAKVTDLEREHALRRRLAALRRSIAWDSFWEDMGQAAGTGLARWGKAQREKRLMSEIGISPDLIALARGGV